MLQQSAPARHATQSSTLHALLPKPPPARPPTHPQKPAHLNSPRRSSTEEMASRGRRLTRVPPSADCQRMYRETSYSHGASSGHSACGSSPCGVGGAGRAKK